MSLFDDIANAQGSERTPGIVEGDHVLEVQRARMRPSQRPGARDEVVTFDLAYVTSTNKSVTPGMPCCYLQKSSWMGSDSRVKALIQAATGKEELTRADIEQVFGTANALQGLRLRAFGTLLDGKTREDGTPIVNVIFRPIE